MQDLAPKQRSLRSNIVGLAPPACIPACAAALLAANITPEGS